MELNPEMIKTILETIGLGGISLVIIYFGYKIIMFFIETWRESTKAINRNSDSHKQLSDVMKTSMERDREFQKELLVLSKETNDKVNELHKKLIIKEEGDK